MKYLCLIYLNEAVEIAARIPSAPLGTVEVRATRQLIVDGRDPL